MKKQGKGEDVVWSNENRYKNLNSEELNLPKNNFPKIIFVDKQKNKNLSEEQYNQNRYLNNLDKIVNEDKTVTYTEIPTTYFLENNKWHINFFGSIKQFEKQVENYKYTNKNISFPFNNDNINKEMKFIVYSKLFSIWKNWIVCNVF